MVRHVPETSTHRMQRTLGKWQGPLWAGRRVGILGGSFNPAHDGHRQLALEALHSLRLDAVWWLVSPQNPLKANDTTRPLAERIAAARHIANHPAMIVDGLETRLGTRYTRDTLAALRRYYPRTRFVWLMGADNMIQMPQWRGWTQIVAKTPIAVFARPPYSLRALHGKMAMRYRHARCYGACVFHRSGLPAWIYVRMPLNPLSSTMIRARQEKERP